MLYVTSVNQLAHEEFVEIKYSSSTLRVLSAVFSVQLVGNSMYFHVQDVFIIFGLHDLAEEDAFFWKS